MGLSELLFLSLRKQCRSWHSILYFHSVVPQSSMLFFQTNISIYSICINNSSNIWCQDLTMFIFYICCSNSTLWLTQSSLVKQDLRSSNDWRGHYPQFKATPCDSGVFVLLRSRLQYHTNVVNINHTISSPHRQQYTLTVCRTLSSSIIILVDKLQDLEQPKATLRSQNHVSRLLTQPNTQCRNTGLRKQAMSFLGT